MALTIGGVLWKEDGNVPKGASQYYLLVSSEILSEPYNLKTGTTFLGKIMSIEFDKKDTKKPRLPVNAKFYLKRSVAFDYVLLSNDDWVNHFREYGIIGAGITVKVKLETYSDENYPLYSQAEKEA
ncbi:MAG: hypothetical protein ACYCT2_08455 [Thermoplasmataceae archaeon]